MPAVLARWREPRTRRSIASRRVPMGEPARMADGSAIQVGALVPLTRPGWIEAGALLLAGLELAAGEVYDAGGRWALYSCR